MKKFEPNRTIIISDEEYDAYIANKPLNTQLRFIAATSYDELKSFIYLTPNTKRNFTMLTLYHFKKTEASPKISTTEKTGLEGMASEGFFLKTSYRVNTLNNGIQFLGSPKPVENSNPDVADNHTKYPTLVLDFYHRDEYEPMQLAGTVVEQIWIHNSLLPRVFEEVFTNTYNEEIKHPQLYIYLRYRAWLELDKKQIKPEVVQ